MFPSPPHRTGSALLATAGGFVRGATGSRAKKTRDNGRRSPLLQSGRHTAGVTDLPGPRLFYSPTALFPRPLAPPLPDRRGKPGARFGVRRSAALSPAAAGIPGAMIDLPIDPSTRRPFVDIHLCRFDAIAAAEGGQERPVWHPGRTSFSSPPCFATWLIARDRTPEP